MTPTLHAIQRFQERVSPVSFGEATRRIVDAMGSVTVRGTPRRWTPAYPSPGLTFAYPTQLPGVCFLVREQVVVTVYERTSCRGWRPRYDYDFAPRHKRNQAYKRPSPGQRFEEWV